MDKEVPLPSIDECRRWIQKLQRMATSLQEKGDGGGSEHLRYRRRSG